MQKRCSQGGGAGGSLLASVSYAYRGWRWICRPREANAGRNATPTLFRVRVRVMSARGLPMRPPGLVAPSPFVELQLAARRAQSASRSLRRVLLKPQVNPGTLYRCGKGT